MIFKVTFVGLTTPKILETPLDVTFQNPLEKKPALPRNISK